MYTSMISSFRPTWSCRQFHSKNDILSYSIVMAATILTESHNCWARYCLYCIKVFNITDEGIERELLISICSVLETYYNFCSWESRSERPLSVQLIVLPRIKLSRSFNMAWYYMYMQIEQLVQPVIQWNQNYYCRSLLEENPAYATIIQ